MENTKKNQTIIISVIISILVLYFLPLIGNALDTNPPEINDVSVGRQFWPQSVFLQREVAGNLSFTCSVKETTGPPENVSLNITRPNNLMMNITMPIDQTSTPPFYNYFYIFNDSLNLGSYHFYIWAKDTAGNSNQSENYYFVIIANRMNYIHVDASNVNSPWDGTAQHPFKTIEDGLVAVNPYGTIFVHNGIYNGIFSSSYGINQSVLLEGESKENTIIDGSSAVTDFVIGLYGTQITTLSNLTIQNGFLMGIHLNSASNKRITNCIIRNNPSAIVVDSSDYNILTNCTIKNNTNSITFHSESDNNQIYHNNFIGNTHQITGNLGVNIWDNGRTGNYWENYQKLYPSATINTTTGTWNTPFTINANNIDHHPWVNANGIYNNPPATPNMPSGVTNGYTNTTYTYTTTTATDPDGDPVFYLFNWGDGTTTSWMINPTANHQWTTPGNYQVKVKAKDSHDSETEWSSSIPLQIITQTIPENQLQINAPASLTERTTFTVTITVNRATLENAAVTFAGITRNTNTLGQVSFTAPEVSQNTEYPVSAQHTGYTSATTNIIVLHHEQQQGYIYGVVRDASTNTPLQTASVTIVFSAQENQIIFTDTNGRYNVLVPIGTYTVIASKQGYLTETKQNIQIQENSAIEQNFALEKTTPTSSGTTDQQASIMEYTIQQKAAQGDIGAQIILQPQDKTIAYYRQGLIITLLPLLNQTFSFTINASLNTTGTILVCRIGPGVLSDLDNISLTYDNKSLNETTDIASFFSIQENTTASWFRILTTQGLYILVRIPHFSTHTITITSLQHIIETFGGIPAILTYILIAVVVIVLFIGAGELTKRL